MSVFEAARRCFFQKMKLLVCRRHVAVADELGIISLASDPEFHIIKMAPSGYHWWYIIRRMALKCLTGLKAKAFFENKCHYLPQISFYLLFFFL